MSPATALKRALVSLLLNIARQYGIVLNIKHDSPDEQIKKSFRKVVIRVHPDKLRSSRCPLLAIFFAGHVPHMVTRAWGRSL